MNIPVYIGLTLILFGGAAYMTGQAISATWRPLYQVVLYAMLLGAANRFMVFALFEGDLLSLSGYLVDTATILAIALLAFRVTRVKRMVSQYPWLYRRTSLFTWTGISE